MSKYAVEVTMEQGHGAIIVGKHQVEADSPERASKIAAGNEIDWYLERDAEVPAMTKVVVREVHAESGITLPRPVLIQHPAQF